MRLVIFLSLPSLTQVFIAPESSPNNAAYCIISASGQYSRVNGGQGWGRGTIIDFQTIFYDIIKLNNFPKWQLHVKREYDSWPVAYICISYLHPFPIWHCYSRQGKEYFLPTGSFLYGEENGKGRSLQTLMITWKNIKIISPILIIIEIEATS